MPQISLFANVGKPGNPDNVDFLQHLDDIRDGRWEDLVNTVRIENDKEKRDAIKRTMPTATFSGLFSYRSQAKLLEHSGIINIDIDEFEGDINELKDRFIADPSVYVVFVSTSGRGLRVMFKIHPKEHRRSFYGISEYISKVYGIVCDSGSIDFSKPFIVSYDPTLHIHEKAPLWTTYPKETVVKKDVTFIHTPTDFKEVYTNIIQRGIAIAESHADYLKLGFALSEQFGEEGRDYFHHLCQCSPSKYKFVKVDKQYDYCLKSKGNGINISSFYYLAKANGVNIVSEKTKLIIKTTINGRKAGLKQDGILKNLRDHHGIEDAEEVVKKTYEDDTIKIDVSDDNVVDQFEMYMSDNFSLRCNEITGYFEEGRVRKTERDLNTIFKDAKKKIQKLDKSLMMTILKSSFVPTYNPFFDILGSDGIPVVLPPISDPENNAKYKSPLIDILASCIKNKDEKHTRYFLRKWMVGIISSMHRDKSPLFLALVGPQGTGKTYFLRNLLPKEMMDYFVQTRFNKGKDSEFELCENLIAFDDEMVAFRLINIVDFNALIDQHWFSLRRPYGTHNEKTLAYAVWCGTSNYYDVVKDPISNRRMIPVEVLDIDKELFNSINKLDLLKEAYQMYKDGFDWRIISPDDKKFLNKDLVKYETTVFERDILEKYFEPNHDSETAIRLNTTEILIELEKYTKKNLSMKSISNELNKKDQDGNPIWIKKSTREGAESGKKWLVNRINRDDHPLHQFLT